MVNAQEQTGLVPVHPIVILRASLRDWNCDFDHENGQYENQCCKCRQFFTGHKRRVICRVCHEQRVIDRVTVDQP